MWLFKVYTIYPDQLLASGKMVLMHKVVLADDFVDAIKAVDQIYGIKQFEISSIKLI